MELTRVRQTSLDQTKQTQTELGRMGPEGERTWEDETHQGQTGLGGMEPIMFRANQAGSDSAGPDWTGRTGHEWVTANQAGWEPLGSE